MKFWIGVAVGIAAGVAGYRAACSQSTRDAVEACRTKIIGLIDRAIEATD